MSFYTSLTGINAATALLGVTSNNIANVGTTASNAHALTLATSLPPRRCKKPPVPSVKGFHSSR